MSQDSSVSEIDVIVGGIVSLSMVDFPGHLAVAIFLQGCNWRCRYCHNKHLQQTFAKDGLPWTDIKHLIKERAHFVDSIVFSGGEPLVHPGLRHAIEDLKEFKLLTALHTSGALPKRLANVIDLVDWVGFDVKAPFDKYEIITGVENSGQKTSESLDILLASGKSYEVRITLDPVLTIDDIKDTLKELYDRGVQVVALQNIRTKKNTIVPHPFLSDLDAMKTAGTMFKTLITRNT